jgi:hypothetical protein
MPQPTNDASRSRIADVMLKFFWLTLRPVERFLTQCISVSTEPTVFVRECIRLGDTTNFLRAAGFFVSAISTAFLAEVATLYLLGIGNLAEPYYWLFILLTSIPFVLVCFLLVRLVAPLSFEDVLHLSFHPMPHWLLLQLSSASLILHVHDKLSAPQGSIDARLAELCPLDDSRHGLS